MRTGTTAGRSADASGRCRWRPGITAAAPPARARRRPVVPSARAAAHQHVGAGAGIGADQVPENVVVADVVAELPEEHLVFVTQCRDVEVVEARACEHLVPGLPECAVLGHVVRADNRLEKPFECGDRRPIVGFAAGKQEAVPGSLLHVVRHDEQRLSRGGFVAVHAFDDVEAEVDRSDVGVPAVALHADHLVLLDEPLAAGSVGRGQLLRHCVDPVGDDPGDPVHRVIATARLGLHVSQRVVHVPDQGPLVRRRADRLAIHEVVEADVEELGKGGELLETWARPPVRVLGEGRGRDVHGTENFFPVSSVAPLDQAAQHLLELHRALAHFTHRPICPFMGDWGLSLAM